MTSLGLRMLGLRRCERLTPQLGTVCSQVLLNLGYFEVTCLPLVSHVFHMVDFQ
jgi:hypothetical protein